jgi:Protein of unknown function (DUF4241)
MPPVRGHRDGPAAGGDRGGEVGQLAQQYRGYPVDDGAGTLADMVAVQVLAGWDFDRLDEVYIPAQVPAAPAAIGAVTDQATDANVITVSSGWGDGIDPTFIGYAVDGAVTSFATDFLVVATRQANT